MQQIFLKLKVVFIVGFLTLTACDKKFQSASVELASTARDSLGCENLRSRVFDSMYSYLDQQHASPESSSLKKDLQDSVLSLQAKGADPKKLKTLAQEILHLYSLLNEKTKSALDTKDYKEHLRALIQLEMGNRSTAGHIEIESELQASMKKVEAMSQELALSCASPPATPAPAPVTEPTAPTLPPTQPGTIEQSKSLAHFGAHFAFATAYQSCQVLDLPDVTANTENVVGVEKGKDIGGGYQRYYASVPDIQRTHYYIRNMTYSGSCIPVNKRPLVYDFGGEPAVETSRLNFFVNSGAGGSALGLDCSAFISSALAAAGLKYTPQVENKPIFVRQLSYDFINPQSSGWKCFDRVSMDAQGNLSEGDILAVEGHVVMVDRVGQDPFGLAKIDKPSSCAQISYKDFDFTVIQSSPSKGSIGINRYAARDYLSESDKMRVAFEKYGRAACQAHFSGKAVAVTDTTFGLIRHKQTPECVSKRVELAGQSCVNSCAEFANR